MALMLVADNLMQIEQGLTACLPENPTEGLPVLQRVQMEAGTEDGCVAACAGWPLVLMLRKCRCRRHPVMQSTATTEDA